MLYDFTEKNNKLKYFDLQLISFWEFGIHTHDIYNSFIYNSLKFRLYCQNMNVNNELSRYIHGKPIISGVYIHGAYSQFHGQDDM